MEGIVLRIVGFAMLVDLIFMLVCLIFLSEIESPSVRRMGESILRRLSWKKFGKTGTSKLEN